MNTPSKRFLRAHDKLVTAFFNGTLFAGNCAHCAVGNILDGDPKWNILLSLRDMPPPSSCVNTIREVEMEVADKCGYTWDELKEVEKAFEEATEIKSITYDIEGEKHHRYFRGDALDLCAPSEEEMLEDQYNGLMAAMDVLMDIEGITTPQYKEEFKKHPKLQLA